MKHKKRISILLTMMFVFTLIGPASNVITSTAAVPKTLSISSSNTKTYISSSFTHSTGDMLISILCFNTYSGNRGTLEIQKYNTATATWTTAYTKFQGLKVGSTIATHFGEKVFLGSGTYRLVFTANNPVSLNGSVQYFY